MLWQSYSDTENLYRYISDRKYTIIIGKHCEIGLLSQGAEGIMTALAKDKDFLSIVIRMKDGTK